MQRKRNPLVRGYLSSGDEDGDAGVFLKQGMEEE